MPKSSYRVVLVTAGSKPEALKIAKALLTRKLAACVSLIPGMESHYRWKGRLEKNREILMMIKTSRSRVKGLIREVKKIHSYDVFEAISLPVLEGNPAYLKWMEESL